MAAKAMTIKLIVDKSKNRVVFAESGKEFVDVLLSFLTLPLGTIVRLLDKQSSMQCLDNLYKSVEGLDAACFKTEACRSMLLRPSNCAEDKCKCLPIHIADMGAPRYFTSGCSCDPLSMFPNSRCSHGMAMNVELNLLQKSFSSRDEMVFVRGASGVMRFNISDDMVISVPTTEGLLLLFDRLGVGDKSSLEVREVHVGRSEVLHLLRQSVCSKMAFTSVFLEKEENIPMQLLWSQQPQTTNASSSQFTKISVKLVLNKHNKKLLYAECKQDFVDLLFSFLAYPSGLVVKLLGEESHMICIDNLYKSTKCLSSECCLKDRDSKELLLNPMLPKHFSIKNQLVKTEEPAPERFYMCRKGGCTFKHLSKVPNVLCGCNWITDRRLSLLDPKVDPSDYEATGGLLRGTMYVVHDNLVATPLSSAMVVSDHLKGAQEGMEILTVEIGEEEGLALLRASLTSKTVLTDALFRSRMDTMVVKKRRRYWLTQLPSGNDN